MITQGSKIKSPTCLTLVFAFVFLSLLYNTGIADAACTRNYPSVLFTPTSGVVVVPPASNTKVYTVTITNNDKEDTPGECGGSSTFSLSIVPETNPGSFVTPSVLGSGSTGPLALGARYNTTLTVTAAVSITEGHTLTTIVQAADPVNHGGATPKTGKGSVITKASAYKGEGNIIKRAKEETCHACHKTDRNRTPSDADWGEAIKTHSSTSLNSNKWSASGGWGVAGGKYGEFVCTTCHTAHDTKNIYLIKETITTPDGTNFQGRASNSVAVDFRVRSGTPANPGPQTPGIMGDDSVTHATSAFICEVCHTYDSLQSTGVNKHAYTMTVTTTHNNGVDCISCHDHKKSFSGGGCTGCHGNPPTTTNIGGPDGLATPATGATNPVSPGAHQVHAVTRSMLCDTCHTGGMPASAIPSNTIHIGFTINNTNVPGFVGSSTGGTLDAHSPLNAPYTGWVAAAGTTVNLVGGYTTNCSSLYCHGSTLTAGTKTNPSWVGGSGEAVCGTCHGGTAYNQASANPPTAGNHTKHASTAAGNLALACNKCHNSTLNMSHVNGDVAWSLDSTDQKIGASATYSGALSGSTGGLAPSGTYGNCANIYCHSNVQGQTDGTGSPTSYASPQWGGSTTCASCHVDMSSSPSATGSHIKHAQTNGYACSTCHNSAGSGTTKHADRNIDVTFTALNPSGTYNGSNTVPGDHTPGQGYGTCSTVYCHSDGAGTYQSPVWGGTVSCGNCHGLPPNTGKHSTHTDGTGAAYGNDSNSSITTAYRFNCGNCHPLSSSNHANGTIDIELYNASATGFKANNPSTASRTGTGTNTQCSDVYCHSNGASGADRAYKQTPTWGGAFPAANKCGQCHDNPPQYAGQSHYVSTGFMGKEGGHFVGVHFDNIYTGSTGLASAGTGNTNSHGNSAYSTTMSCYICHNGEVSSTTIDTYALNNLGSSSMKCSTASCHTGVSTTPSQNGVITDKSKHINAAKNVDIANMANTMRSKAQLRTASKPATWTQNVGYKVAGSYDSATINSTDWSSGTKTCTTACHNGQPVTWGDTNITCYSCHTSL